jgi:hypothetical protein
MILCNLLDDGLSHSGPFLRPSKSMRDGPPGTNTRQQSPIAWQVR